MNLQTITKTLIGSNFVSLLSFIGNFGILNWASIDKGIVTIATIQNTHLQPADVNRPPIMVPVTLAIPPQAQNIANAVSLVDLFSNSATIILIAEGIVAAAPINRILNKMKLYLTIKDLT